jgi:hypothetical protein
MAVLEGDLVIYEYITVRARTIADQLEATVTRIRNAIQAHHHHRSNTIVLPTRNNHPHDPATVATINQQHYNNNTSERSFVSANSNHTNNDNKNSTMTMNHGPVLGGGMNQNSERSYDSRDGGHRNNNAPHQGNYDNGREAVARLASIIHDHNENACNDPTKPRNNDQNTIHQIVSVIKQNAGIESRRDYGNEMIPKTIVAAASSLQQHQYQHQPIHYKTKTPESTNFLNTVSTAASSFSVPLKHPSKPPPAGVNTTSYRQQVHDMNANGQILLIRDAAAVPSKLQNSSVSLSSSSMHLDTGSADDGDMKPAASSRSTSSNKKSVDNKESSEDQLKRHVSDELSRLSTGNESDDMAAVKGTESTVQSYKAKELEKIKEEARILAQYAEFSRRVLEKKGVRTSTTPKLQDDNEKVKKNTTSGNAVSNVTMSEEVAHHLENVPVIANDEIEARTKELEKIKDQARFIASRTRKLMAEDVPEVLTTQRTHPSTSDELDMSSVSDPTMLFDRHDDNITSNASNNKQAIRHEVRRIAQYTYQIIAGDTGKVNNSAKPGIATPSNTETHNTSISPSSNQATLPMNSNDSVNSRLGKPSKPYPAEVVISEDHESTEGEARIIDDYEHHSQQTPTKTSNVQGDVPPNLIDNDMHGDITLLENSTKDIHKESENSSNSNLSIADTREVPLDRLNSLGEVISEERAKELARIKEEARLLALQVRRPSKGVKRLSNGAVATYVAKPPEIDYVVNPDVPRLRLDNASKSRIEYVTWKDVLGDSIWATPNDVGVAADSVIISLAQFIPCRLQEDDRSGRYSHLEIGYVGVCCKNCYGQAGYGRYFPTTLPSFISSFPSTVVKHILDDCTSCPKLIKDTVNEVERVNQRSLLRCSTHAGSKGLMNFVWESIRNAKSEEIDAYEEQKRLGILKSPIGGLSIAITWEELLRNSDIAAIEDEALVPNSYLALWGQYKKCVSEASDCSRTGRLRAREMGDIGYCCHHCNGKPYSIGSRLFPTNLMTLQQPEFIDRMRGHLSADCKSCPPLIRNAFQEFEANERIVSGPRHGSKKLFFRRIWKRLHNTQEPEDDVTNSNVAWVESIGDSNEVNDQDIADEPIIKELITGSIIVTMDERGLVPDVVLVAYGQLKPCRLEQMDKAGWYKDREIGFPGLCCKHCGGRPSSGRYFPKTGDNFLRSSKHSIIRHLIELCTNCPDNIRTVLQRLQHKDALKADFQNADEAVLGAGKNFHQLLWVRLYKHYNVPHGYYEALDYSQKSKEKQVARYAKKYGPTSSSISPYVKKRKVDYGRSNPHRKTSEYSNI